MLFIPPELLLPEVFIPLFVLVGCILGSFYTVCIHRYHTDESLALPASHCLHCGRALRWWEMFPILSYLALKGRCATCKARLSLSYPLTESLSGLMAGLLAWRYGPSGTFVVYMVCVGLLLIGSGIDIRMHILPDEITLGGFLFAVPSAVYVLEMSWTGVLLGALLGGGSFWLIATIFRMARGIDGLGLGDVKLMLFLGALFGPLYLPLITLMAGVSGLLAALIAVWVKPRKWRSSPWEHVRETPVAFGPFLSFGAFVTMVAGPDILYWWLELTT